MNRTPKVDRRFGFADIALVVTYVTAFIAIILDTIAHP